MHIGIISNSDECILLAYTLANHGFQVCVFFSPPPDNYIHQKVTTLLHSINIPCTIEQDQKTDVYNWLEQKGLAVVFVLGYRYLLDVKIFGKLNISAFNIHYGPLPSFRGPVPVFWQLKQGESSLEISIHRLSSKFDDGEVVWKKETSNLPHYNYSYVHQLFSRLCIEGVEFILSVIKSQFPLPDLRAKSKISAYYKRPQLTDVMINWDTMKGEEICDLVRACNPWNKGAQTLFYQQEAKLMDAQLMNDSSTERAGTILDNNECILIACADTKIIKVGMLYVSDYFIPAYQAEVWGFVKGKVFG
ncbi:methionyl-tRNA formyltransferase [Chitinophaga sp. CF118]|uniref:formyltransferase family protein n=1 Tax=Chitinophaga sp. CF118 TaxID=1884367 RepID=UPI0008EF1DFC|nr:formyltransferase family protein [Chitinophaga sp. CF118]SFD79599.1 methionyl-tRNA formyltransferase [Chitinophaga sp. CF118]